MVSIKTIAFDFGRVIGHFDHRRTSNFLAKHTSMSADALHAFLFGSQLEDDYESGRMSSEAFVRKVREACALTCETELISQAWADIFWPNEAVCGLLPRLRPDYRLILASNTNELHSRQFTQQFAETFRYFDALVLSHEIGARKPSREFFERCLVQAQCKPEECLFIDDLPANVAGARACGWNGIVYRGFGDLQSDLAAYGINEIDAGESGGRE